ncbi:hypothetical protein K0M31_011125 [Melipona bicolor]|uniref:Uncharacterized protein n=1 Tax=Melipona bicolor TaxID=60889 RepID=A0AA40KUQ4_9HYME|nr:hypothetical protein K0M31_011125 [Melipona bicolor]
MPEKTLCPAEISYFVSGVPDLLEGGTIRPPSSGAPHTAVSPKNFKREHLGNQEMCPAQISYFVSGEHNIGGGGTMSPAAQRFS